MVDSPKLDGPPENEDCDEPSEVPDSAADPDFDAPSHPTLGEFAQRRAAEYLHNRKDPALDPDE